MKVLRVKDIGALMRLSSKEQAEIESKVAAYQGCDFALMALLANAASVKRIKELGKVTRLPKIVQASPLVGVCNSAWDDTKNRRERVDEHGCRSFEAYPILERSSFTNQVYWHPFEARCSRSFSAYSSISRTLADALTGVLSDMVDNIIQHSGQTSTIPSRGVASYFATQTECGFVVCDSGRGALASLKSNLLWSALQSEGDALDAILSKGATRRAENSFGDGYRTLFRAMIDHEFEVVLWSGDAFVSIALEHGERKEVSYSVEPIPGFAIGVSKKII